MSQNLSPFPEKLLAPKHWLTWTGVGLLWLLAHLPWRMQLRIGAAIGWLFYQLGPQRVSDTRINLGLCFPEKSDTEREAMVRDVFRNTGISIFETLGAWFRGPEYFHNKVIVTGEENIKAALAAGRSYFLVGPHFTTLDLYGTLASRYIQVDMVYRPQKNPVMEYIMTRGRSSSQGRMISHRDMRLLLRRIRDGHNVWYAIDQDYGAQQAVFVPFFGVPAATLTTVSRLASAHKLPVFFIGCRREGDQQKYHLTFTPLLENFPSGDDVADTTRVNLEVEKLVRQAPTQYMWFHRRFKTQPAGQKPPYPPKPKELRRQREAAQAAERDQA